MHGYDPAAWAGFFTAVTGAAAALTGLLFAGVSLAAHWGGGLCWLAPAALCGIAGAVYSTWALLVEIVR